MFSLIGKHLKYRIVNQIRNGVWNILNVKVITNSEKQCIFEQNINSNRFDKIY